MVSDINSVIIVGNYLQNKSIRLFLCNSNTSPKWQHGGMVKSTATDMRYFARSKFFGSLVHKKNFGLT